MVYTRNCGICKKKIPTTARCAILAEDILVRKDGTFTLYSEDFRYFCKKCMTKVPDIK